MGADLGCIRLVFKVLGIVWEVTQELKLQFYLEGYKLQNFTLKSQTTLSHIWGLISSLSLITIDQGC